MSDKKLIIQGAGSKPKPPKEGKNTLKSVSKGHIVDLLGYGPVKGLVNGLQSVLLDDTPIQNEDGTFNFDGISLDMRLGDPNQDVIPGFRAIATPRSVNSEVTYDNPLVRSVITPEADAVAVTISIPSLVESNDNGDTFATTLPLRVDIQNGSGQWQTKVVDTINGKNTSSYEKTYRIELTGEGPFAVRVSRTNRESDSSKKRDTLSWQMLTEITDVRHSYPNCVLAGISVDAALFGNNLPSRKYLMDLSIVSVPSNYDPITRKYTGFWDGTFKQAWTDNPAWCYYDLATHPIIGAGIGNVNKWALYEIGRYCDELVDDGFGGKEPRFTCNTIISSAEDAIMALSSLATVFRGMNYWGSNTIEPVADMPGPIRKIITPAEVLDGEFNYAGSSLKDRHSVAIVMWNDPKDGYESKPEMVEDPESIELLGWREKQITAVACTSRGQARRLGLWALYSERAETQILTFKVPIKHADFRPGDYFEVQDPYRAGARLGGRVTKIEGRNLTLDAVPTEAAVGWKITLETAEGGLLQGTISNITGKVITTSLDYSTQIDKGCTFILSSAAISAQTFRVATVTEEEGSIYTITASSHDPRKYDHIEKGLALSEVPMSFIPTGQIKSPKNLTSRSYKYVEGGTENQALTVGWTAPDDARATNFLLEVKGPDDLAFSSAYVGPAVSYDIRQVYAGRWYFRVRVQSEEWGQSAWIENSFDIEGLLVPLAPTTLRLTSTSNSITVTPIINSQTSEFEFYRSNVPLMEAMVESNANYMATGTFFVDQNLMFDTEYFYYVRGVNLYGKSKFTPGSIRTKADVDEILEVILKEYQESAIGKFFKGEIDKISGNGPGSVNERVEGVDLKADDTLAELDRIAIELEGKLENLNQQLALFSSAQEWNPTEPFYLEGTIIQWSGGLYSALQKVPGGIEPGTDELYWLRIGDFESLSEGISDLALRVTTAETTVVEIGGVVTPMSSQMNSMSAMWREDDEGEEDLEAALRAWDSQAEFIEEVKVRASETEALSQRITNFNTSVGDLSSSITLLEESFTTETEAIARSLSALEAEIDGEDGVKASIVAERDARVTEQLALANAIDAMGVHFGEELSSAIQLERSTSADENSARAQEINTLQSSLNDTNASVQTNQSTIADVNGRLAANWGVKVQLDKNGKNPTVAGIGLEVDNTKGSPTSKFVVKADEFAVVQGAGDAETVPFAVVNGQVILKDAMIGNIIKSTDYQKGKKGWMLDKSGDAQFNGILDIADMTYQGKNLVQEYYPPAVTLRNYNSTSGSSVGVVSIGKFAVDGGGGTATLASIFSGSISFSVQWEDRYISFSSSNKKWTGFSASCEVITQVSEDNTTWSDVALSKASLSRTATSSKPRVITANSPVTIISHRDLGYVGKNKAYFYFRVLVRNTVVDTSNGANKAHAIMKDVTINLNSEIYFSRI